MALLDNFIANLEAACTEKDISQRELSRRSGVHYVTISRIFGRTLSPSVEACEKLARAAGLRPDTVFLEPEKVA